METKIIFEWHELTEAQQDNVVYDCQHILPGTYAVILRSVFQQVQPEVIFVEANNYLAITAKGIVEVLRVYKNQ